MGWIKVGSTKQTNISGYLGDIESRLPKRHPYKSNNYINWAHEGTHGVNSVLRNRYPGRINASYMLGGIAMIQTEPQITLKQLSKEIPTSFIGTGYNLYIVYPQIDHWINYNGKCTLAKNWNNQPLYIADEFSAYCNGTFVGHEHRYSYRDTSYSFQLTIEMYGYLKILEKIVPTNDLITFLSFCLIRLKTMCELGRDKWINNSHIQQLQMIEDYK